MEIKVTRITPALARDWLKRNVDNRDLRATAVDGMRQAFERGEYVQTHQGIAFDVNGRLIDGQHRLHAIAGMPEHFAIDMPVARGLHPDAFKVIDIGNKRSNADVLRIDQGLAGVARFLAVLMDHDRSSITPQSLIPYVKGLENAYASLIAYTPKKTKAWSSAAVRSAAILRMVGGGDMDYVLLSYHALNHAEYDSMSPVVQALNRQLASGKAQTGNIDLFCRAYRAFDVRRQMVPTIQIMDTSSIAAEARQVVATFVLGQKKAATSAAAKKVNGANSTRRVAA